MVNYYKLLKVSVKASQAEIKSAYRRLARKMHPDLNGGSEEAGEKFALVVKAYEVLSDPEQRASFDKKLNGNADAIHQTDSVFSSENSHALKLREIALEMRYNQIVDEMINSDRRERLELQRVLFPLVGLFVSIFAVTLFKPIFWAQLGVIGRIVLLTISAVGMVRIFHAIRVGIDRYTEPDYFEDIAENETANPERRHSRLSAILILLVGFSVSIGAGVILGTNADSLFGIGLSKFFSGTLEWDLVLYPPIVVLLVEIMHSIVARFDL